MPHIGIICPELTGHLNPTMAIARQLQTRGHRVTFYQRLNSQKKIEAAGFNYRPFGIHDLSLDVIADQERRLAELSGRAALNYTVYIIAARTTACLREVPDMMKQDRIDLILTDQICREGSTIAEQLSLPYIVLCNALALNPEPDIPAFCTTWAYRPSLLRRLRNRAFDRLLHHIARPLAVPIDNHRRKVGLPPITGYVDTGRAFAEITQQPREFDFPRRNLRPNFHYAGPAIDGSVRQSIPFPFEKLGARPLIYASLGTLQNRLATIFATIAHACENLPVQLVLSLGGGCKPDSLPPLPGSPIVVEFAPQLELLKRAKLCITHAGLNTALECLSQGIPMVAIPITNDQPGVAARIKYLNCGEFIPLKKLTTPRLRTAITQVLTNPTYTTSAQSLRAAITQQNGPSRTADIIEQAL